MLLILFLVDYNTLFITNYNYKIKINLNINFLSFNYFYVIFKNDNVKLIIKNNYLHI